MRKIIFILLSVTIWWACEDNDEPIVGPEGVVSEFTDSRDGKVYKCVTIGGQTWMAENLAYRLPLGSVDGCFTYREEFVDTIRIKPTTEDMFAAINEAIEDGTISSDIMPETAATPMPMSPAQCVLMCIEMSGGDYMAFQVAFTEWYLPYYPSLEPVGEFLSGLSETLKKVAIVQAVEKQWDKAEKLTGGYVDTYGLLYTYEGALKGLPEGWRLPTDEDWKQLEKTLGMNENELNLLEEWRGATAGILLHDAKTGFNVNYAGTRAYGTFNYDSPFMNKDMNAYYWSSSRLAQTDSTEVAVIRTVSRVHDGILRGTSNMTAAYSIRCIKE